MNVHMMAIQMGGEVVCSQALHVIVFLKHTAGSTYVWRMGVLPASRLLSTLPRSPANINIHCGIYQVVFLIDV